MLFRSGHSRGWAAEDMDNNIAYVRSNKELKQDAIDLIKRAVDTSKALLKKKS